MLAEDVRVFLFLFLGMFANYGLVLMVVFPKTKSEEVITQVPLFNNPAGALQSMLELAFLGEALEINLVTDDGSAFMLPILDENGNADYLKTFDLFLFFGLYLIYVIICVVLLLNLLIAMMSSTYDRFRSDSTLLYRKQFAHLVLRLELESKFLTRPPCGLWKPWIQNAGEVTGEKDGKPVYSFLFKDVAANQEGFGLVSSVFLDTSGAKDDASSGDLTCDV